MKGKLGVELPEFRLVLEKSASYSQVIHNRETEKNAGFREESCLQQEKIRLKPDFH
jgi:uncharacterized protein YdcH (DUF465 family)